MRLMGCLFSLVFALIPVVYASATSKPEADLIVRNAKVWTVDKSQPTAQAVAVLGDRIVAVGSNAEVDAWRGPRTRVIDAGGKARRTQVAVGIREGDRVQITSGLMPGDVVITSGGYALSDGLKVRVAGSGS